MDRGACGLHSVGCNESDRTKPLSVHVHLAVRVKGSTARPLLTDVCPLSQAVVSDTATPQTSL